MPDVWQISVRRGENGSGRQRLPQALLQVYNVQEQTTIEQLPTIRRSAAMQDLLREGNPQQECTDHLVEEIIHLDVTSSHAHDQNHSWCTIAQCIKSILLRCT